LACLCAASLIGYALGAFDARAEGLAISATQRQAPAAIREPDLPPDIDSAPLVMTTPSAAAKVGKAEPATTRAEPAPARPDEIAPSPTANAPSGAPSGAGAQASGVAGVKSALTPPGQASSIEPDRTDPEASVAPGVVAGASPVDIAAAIVALPAADSKKSPIASPRVWAAARDAIERFYSSRGDMPIWTDAKGFSAAGRAVIARLDRAEADGLDLSTFAIPDAGETIEQPALLAQAEITLSEAVIAYAFQASGGRIDPTRISPLITAKAEVVDPARALESVSAATDPDAMLASFNPPQKGYRDLRDRLAELRAAYPSGAFNLSRHASKSADSADDRAAPLIRARFDLANGDGRADRSTANPRIAAVVTDLRRPGVSTGEARLDPSMMQALSGRGPLGLEAAILANMEMWRWEPRDMGEERIEVNVADFTLRVLRGDEALHKARIIVGKPDTQTPIFSNAMRYILVNPYWSVPVSIIRKEMLPKLAQDPDYLTRLGYEVTPHGDTISVKQPPGEKNALGRIAFMFPNEHSVYLHDTPSRGLFMASRRAFSHGCVRVDQPIRLAELVMGEGWSEQRFRSLIGGSERTVFLPRPLPIHIEYFTAFVDETGDLQMREDLYGHMRRVESALGLDAQSG